MAFTLPLLSKLNLYPLIPEPQTPQSFPDLFQLAFQLVSKFFQLLRHRARMLPLLNIDAESVKHSGPESHKGRVVPAENAGCDHNGKQKKELAFMHSPQDFVDACGDCSAWLVDGFQCTAERRQLTFLAFPPFEGFLNRLYARGDRTCNSRCSNRC